jgi:hypothetical protein
MAFRRRNGKALTGYIIVFLCRFNFIISLHILFLVLKGDKLSTPPHWMPMYWWRYVNPNVSQTYDQSYDEQMFDMLPDWIRCIVIDKIRSSKVSDGGTNKNNLLRNYTKAVSKVQLVKKDDQTASNISKSNNNDVMLHTASSPNAQGISFTTCGGYGRVKSGTHRIAVPHLARVNALRHQWGTLPIPGRVVVMTYMLASYTNRSSRSKDQNTDSRLSVTGEADDEIDRLSVVDR